MSAYTSWIKTDIGQIELRVGTIYNGVSLKGLSQVVGASSGALYNRVISSFSTPVVVDRTQEAATNISPITCLPVEILSYIFLFTSPAFVVCDSTTPARSLSQVCSYWRAVALHLPQLWSEIDASAEFLEICRRRKTRDVWRMVDSAVQTCLHRSQSHPLSFSFPTFLPLELHSSSALAASHERWENINLSLIHLSHLVGNIKTLNPVYPTLKSIRLDGRSFPLSGSPVSLMNAPGLQTLELVSIAQPFKVLNVTWGLVNHFKATNCYFANSHRDCLTLIQSLENVEVLEWDGDIPLLPTTDSAIHLSSLRVLNLRLKTPYHIMGMLDNLVAPELTKLHIESCSVSASEDNILFSKSIQSFIRRSACSIGDFTVKGFQYALEDDQIKM